MATIGKRFRSPSLDGSLTAAATPRFGPSGAFVAGPDGAPLPSSLAAPLAGGNASTPATVAASALKGLNTAYLRGAKLGAGSCGTVFAATPRGSGAPCALKLISASTKAEHETAVLSRPTMKHPNIINYITTMEDEVTGDLALVTELCPFGDLVGLAEKLRLTDLEVSFIGHQLLAVLAHMHGVARYSHGDMKPDNVLVSSVVLVPASAARFYIASGGDLRACGGELLTAPTRLDQPWQDVVLAKQRADAAAAAGHGERLLVLCHIRVCDFERSIPLPQAGEPLPPSALEVATIQYSAPELWRSRLGLQVHDWCRVSPAAADMFAAAVTLWTLRASSWPFTHPELSSTPRHHPRRRVVERAVGHSIVEWRISNPLPTGIDPEFEALLKRMMDHDVRSRITADQALLHAYFQQITSRMAPRPTRQQLPAAPRPLAAPAAALSAPAASCPPDSWDLDLLLSPAHVGATSSAHTALMSSAATPGMGASTTAATPFVLGAAFTHFGSSLPEPDAAFKLLLDTMGASQHESASGDAGAGACTATLRGTSIGFVLE